MTLLTLMPSSVEETTEEILTRMHTNHSACLTGEMLLDYLMSSMDYLKNVDLDGWKTEFLPVEPKPPTKRIRQSPNLAVFHPMPKCRSCGAEEVIDDVVQGQYVCTQCGLIQQQGVFMGGIAHCSMDRLKTGNRVYIHRYSRVVHFRTTIRLMQGDSNPLIGDEDLLRLQVELGGLDNPGVNDVNKALRKLGLSRKYRRHRCRLAFIIGDVFLPVFDGQTIMKMFKLFRILEYYWNFYHKEISPGRKVFFSYRFIFYQFCHQLNVPQYTGRHHLLKNEKLSRFQFDSYRRASKYTGFPVFE